MLELFVSTASCTRTFWALALVAVVVGVNRRRPQLVGMAVILCATVLSVHALAHCAPETQEAQEERAQEAQLRHANAAAENEQQKDDVAARNAARESAATQRERIVNADRHVARSLNRRATSNAAPPLTVRQAQMQMASAQLPPVRDMYLRKRSTA